VHESPSAKGAVHVLWALAPLLRQIKPLAHSVLTRHGNPAVCSELHVPGQLSPSKPLSQ
jgi:hypothetical protein